MRKPCKRTRKGAFQINTGAALLGDFQTIPSMSCWLEMISGEDMSKLWNGLKVSAKAVPKGTTWARWENGTTSKGERLVDAIAYTTDDGFVVRFTAKST